MYFNHEYYKKRLQNRLLLGLEPPGQAVKQSIKDFNYLRGLEPIPGAPNKSVVILGAGMAGLSCALELQKLGFNVTVLEGDKNHIGGRLRTHHSGNQYAEVGGMRFPKSHKMVFKYIEEFKLPTRKFVMSQDQAFTVIRNTVFKNENIKCPKEDDAPCKLGCMAICKNENSVMDLFRMSEAERENEYSGMWSEGVSKVWDSFTKQEQAEYFSNRLTTQKLIKHDYQSLATAFDEVRLEGKPLSKEAREYVITRMGLEGNLAISVSEFLKESDGNLWGHDFMEIVGGSQKLPQTMARSLSKPILSNCMVTKIFRQNGKPSFNYTQNGQEKNMKCDWLICTIPLGVLSRLDIAEAFSPQKIRAIRGTSYDASTKVIGKAPWRWWELGNKIYGGGSAGDLMIGSTWFPNDNVDKNDDISKQESLFLASYSWGTLARRISGMSRKELDEYIPRQLSIMHPYLRQDPSLYKNELIWSWDSFHLSSGAYAFFNPGEQFRLFQELAEPEGNIFLTGEHASHTHSWVQGSLESALRTSKYIVEHTLANPT